LIKIKYPEFWLSHISVIHSPLSNEQIYSYDPQKLILNDLHLKCCILEEDDENKISGSYPFFPKSSRSKCQFDAYNYKSSLNDNILG